MRRILGALACAALMVAPMGCGSNGGGGGGRTGSAFPAAPPAAPAPPAPPAPPPPPPAATPNTIDVATQDVTLGRGNTTTTVNLTGTDLDLIANVVYKGATLPVNATDPNNASFTVPAGLPGGAGTFTVNPTQASGILPFPGTFTALTLSFTVLGADDVMISEFGNGQGGQGTPNDHEFVEIFNPTSSPIDLSNYYLTDGTNTASGSFYYNIAGPTPATAWSGLSSDFIVQFPAGTIIQPGQYMTIAVTDHDAGAATGTGSPFFFNQYGKDPDFEIVTGGDADSIQDMADPMLGGNTSIGTATGFTSDGEPIILFKWDGVSDLVQDVDYVIWGNAATATNPEAVDKSGITINASTYGADTPLANQARINLTANSIIGIDTPLTIHRLDIYEGNEGTGPGNGGTGVDETSEDLDNTFDANAVMGSPGYGYPAIPANGSTGASTTAPISYRFFRGIDQTLGSIDNTTFAVMDAGGATLNGSYGLTTNGDGSTTVTFTPASPLTPNAAYTVVLQGISKDDGNPYILLGLPLTYGFTTGN